MDQLFHQVSIYKVLMKTESSRTGSIKSNVLNSFKNTEGYKNVKYLLNATTIPEEPEINEETPANINSFRLRAKIIYEKMTNKDESLPLIRSITPNPTLTKL